MKKVKIIRVIVKSITICSVALFAFSCITSKCKVQIKKPNDVKVIDWNNYNSVYDVFWNILKNDCVGSGYPTGDTIKVYGIIDKFEYDDYHSVLRSFQLIDEDIHEDNPIYDYLHNEHKYNAPSVRVFCYRIADELQSIIDTADLTNRKCYIKGELCTSIKGGDIIGFNHKTCCFTVPCVELYSIYDIYFEEEEEQL